MTTNLKRQVAVASLVVLNIAMISHSAEKDKAKFPKHLNQSEWRLCWEDDFSGEQIDKAKWAHCPEWFRGSGQCQWSPKESFLNGKGKLRLGISKRDGKIFSGAVRTRSLFEKKFGYFEIRCKVPVIHGGWCAFWMMPATGNRPGNEGRDGTEIDIFESIAADKGKVNHALHWDGYGKELKSKGFAMDKMSHLYKGYHTYGMLWNEKEYVFYIDGKETWRTSAGGVMQVPGYLKITVEAAKWAGDVFKENLPKYMLVDYVRVYEKKE